MSHNQHEDLRMCNDACFQDFRARDQDAYLVYVVTANQKYAERQILKNQNPLGAILKTFNDDNDDAKKAAEMVAKKNDEFKRVEKDFMQDQPLDKLNKCRDLCVHSSFTSLNLARNLQEITCNEAVSLVTRSCK
jgi:hypothetical protein